MGERLLKALLFFLLFNFNNLAQAQIEISSHLSESNPNWDLFFTQNGRSHIDFGVYFTGNSPYQRNHKKLFAPASNSKIFTTAAALRFLGPDYQIPTVLQWTSNPSDSHQIIYDLTLIGNGDPTWGMQEHGETLHSKLDSFVSHLIQLGVKEVHGPLNVEAADTRWELLRYPEGWEQEDYYSCYGALAQAFNLNINCARLKVLSSTEARWIEKGVPTQVHLDLKPGGKTDIKIIPTVDKNNVSVGFTIAGTWKKNQRPITYIFPIHDTKSWIKNLLIDSLSKNNIKYFPEKNFYQASVSHTKTFYSPKLSKIIIPFMKKSINVVGAAIIKQMALNLDYPHEDLLEGGQWALKEFSYEINNTDLSHEVQLWDGSGISRESYVTPFAVNQVLIDIKNKNYFNYFWKALPIAGVDGTLKNRMKSTSAEGVLRAKTGTLRGVYNLSGYAPVYNSIGEEVDFIPFVLLTKTVSTFKSRARRTQDQAGALLVEINNSTPSNLLGDLFLAGY